MWGSDGGPLVAAWISIRVLVWVAVFVLTVIALSYDDMRYSVARRSNATLAVFNNKLDMSIDNYHGSQDTLWEDFRIDKVGVVIS